MANHNDPAVVRNGQVRSGGGPGSHGPSRGSGEFDYPSPSRRQDTNSTGEMDTSNPPSLLTKDRLMQYITLLCCALTSLQLALYFFSIIMSIHRVKIIISIKMCIRKHNLFIQNELIQD